MRQWRVLVADSDAQVHRELGVMLKSFRHQTRSVFDGASMSSILASEHHDLLLLAAARGDGPDGFSACRHLRAAGDDTPIIMLGDYPHEADIVAGLEAGADDVMTKPVRLAELRSRMKALLRRERYASRLPPIRLGHAVLDHSAHEVRRDAQPVTLTHTEYELLFGLMSKPDRVYSRDELRRAVRGNAASPDPRSIDVYIRHLRLKLERGPSLPTLIQTVRGVGYKATRLTVAIRSP
ncbi:MAG: response regulator transcription factor [Solirubrobacteraceae bacterium]